MSISHITRHSLFLILGLAFVPSAYGQTYFELLAARSDVVVAVAFRSQADVEAHWAPNNHDDVTYDATQDAAMFTWPSSAGSNIDQIQIDINPIISSGTVFVTWEERWGPNWALPGGRSGINGFNTMKNHQLSDQGSFTSGGLQLEVRKWHRKELMSDNDIQAGKAGTIDIRTYFGGGGGPGGEKALFGQLADFVLDIEVWARYFLFIEYGGNGKISLWCTQPGDAPTAIYLEATGDSSGDPGPFGAWWFEHNSSQTYSGPTSHVWNRNFVVLDGVADLAEAQALVNQGASGGPIVRPKPPELDP